MLGIGALFGAGVLAFTLLGRMEFKSSGRLYLGELEGKARGAAMRPTDLDFAGGDSGDLGSEIQILQSTTLLGRAILASGANVGVKPLGWEPPRYWQWRAAGRNVALLDAGLREISPSHVRLDDESRGLADFHVKFTDATQYEVWADNHRLGTGTLGETAKLDGLTLTLSAGTQGKPAAGSEYVVRVAPLEDALRDVNKTLTIGYPKAITPGEAVRVISLDYSNDSPIVAARLLRELMNGYLDARRSWKTEDASAAEDFVKEQLSVLRASLDRTEQRLADYRTTNSKVVLDSEAKAMIEQIAKYEEQRVATKLQVAALADMKRSLKNPNAQLESFLLGDSKDTVLEGLASNLTKSRQELASLEERFSPAAPDVKQAQAGVDQQLEVIKNYIGTRHNRAQESLGALNHVIGQFEDKLKTVPGAELGLAQLARESEVFSKMYSYLLERQQQAAIVKASTVSKNRVLDAPQVPYREYSPRLPVRLGAALLGILLGIAFVVLRRVFASTLQTEADVQRLAGRLAIFASVPHRADVPGRDKLHPEFDLLEQSPSSAFAEAFRMLRANLYTTRGRDHGKVVLFTSPCPGDGKSTSAVALAVLLAADRRNVLLIDADVRKPSHHTLLRQAIEPGLSNVLTRQCDWQTAIRPVRAAYGDFYSLTAGKSAPAELLTSESLASFLAQATARFDFVLIDAASFPLVSDALVLASHADCVVSVLRLQYTPRKLAAEHVRRIADQARDYGIVVNDGTFSQTYGSAKGYLDDAASVAIPRRS